MEHLYLIECDNEKHIMEGDSDEFFGRLVKKLEVTCCKDCMYFRPSGYKDHDDCNRAVHTFCMKHTKFSYEYTSFHYVDGNDFCSNGVAKRERG